MSKLFKGMVIRTSYGTGPYIVESVTENCTCPSFLDSLEFGNDAPLSKPHCHIVCRSLEARGPFYLNGYDENLNSVWSNDRIIICSEETLFLTMCSML